MNSDTGFGMNNLAAVLAAGAQKKVLPIEMVSGNMECLNNKKEGSQTNEYAK